MAKQKSAAGDLSEVVLKHWRETVPYDRMAHLVKDVTRAFLRALQVRLAKHDVPLGMWTFLRILWERDGLTQRELSHAAGVMEPTAVMALRALEARGYILRQQKPGNRKNVYVFLTPAGRWLQGSLIPVAEEVNAIATRGISDADIATMRRALLAVLENLAQDENTSSQGDVAAAADDARRSVAVKAKTNARKRASVGANARTRDAAGD